MAIDPPYRFDPWQNLVRCHWGEMDTGGFPATVLASWYFAFDSKTIYLDDGGDSCSPVQYTMPPGRTGIATGYDGYFNGSLNSIGGIPSSVTVTGNPTVTPLNHSWSPWSIVAPYFPNQVWTPPNLDNMTHDFSISAIEILGSGIGCYGNGDDLYGLVGGGVDGDTIQVGTVSVDCSTASIVSNDTGGPVYAIHSVSASAGSGVLINVTFVEVTA